MAVEKQEGQIAEAVKSLVRQTELRRVATSAGSLVVAAGILLTTLGIGALIEWMGLLKYLGVNCYDLTGSRLGERFLQLL